MENIRKKLLIISLLNLFGIFGIADLFLFLEASSSFFPYIPFLGGIATLIALILGFRLIGSKLKQILPVRKFLMANFVVSILILVASVLYFLSIIFIFFILGASPL